MLNTKDEYLNFKWKQISKIRNIQQNNLQIKWKVMFNCNKTIQLRSQSIKKYLTVGQKSIKQKNHLNSSGHTQ